MSRQRVLIVVACAALCSAAAVAAYFTWIGQGDDYLWTTCENWDRWPQDAQCYPCEPEDSAIIPQGNPKWLVEFVTEQIDVLYIQGVVSVSGNRGTVLTTREVQIWGRYGEVTVELNRGRIRAVPPS